MYTVELVIDGFTDVWITEAVLAAIQEHDGLDSEEIELEDAEGSMFERLAFFANSEPAGFEAFIGDQGSKYPIRIEWDDVYRIGLGDLFRIYGFFRRRHSEFIALEAHWKPGQKNDDETNRVIEKVARARSSSNGWKKADS